MPAGPAPVGIAGGTPESRCHGGLNELEDHIPVLWMSAILADMTAGFRYEVFRT